MNSMPFIYRRATGSGFVTPRGVRAAVIAAIGEGGLSTGLAEACRTLSVSFLSYMRCGLTYSCISKASTTFKIG